MIYYIKNNTDTTIALTHVNTDKSLVELNFIASAYTEIMNDETSIYSNGLLIVKHFITNVITKVTSKDITLYCKVSAADANYIVINPDTALGLLIKWNETLKSGLIPYLDNTSKKCYFDLNTNSLCIYNVLDNKFYTVPLLAIEDA